MYNVCKIKLPYTWHCGNLYTSETLIVSSTHIISSSKNRNKAYGMLLKAYGMLLLEHAWLCVLYWLYIIIFCISIFRQAPIPELGPSLISISTLPRYPARPPRLPRLNPVVSRVRMRSSTRWEGTWGNPREIPFCISSEDGCSVLQYGHVGS